MAVKREMTLDIKGNSWKFEVISDRTFIKRHGKEHHDSGAVTSTPDNVVSFRKSSLSFHSIVHELIHVFVFESHTESMEQSLDDREELCASIISNNYFLIGSLAEKILTGLTIND